MGWGFFHNPLPEWGTFGRGRGFWKNLNAPLETFTASVAKEMCFSDKFPLIYFRRWLLRSVHPDKSGVENGMNVQVLKVYGNAILRYQEKSVCIII